MVTGVAQGIADQFAWVIYISLAIASLYVLFLIIVAACGFFLWATRRWSRRHGEDAVSR